jgi:hypothetical protein
MISSPTPIRFSGIDPELDDLALGLDVRLGEVAAHGLGGALGLGRPAPSWTAV